METQIIKPDRLDEAAECIKNGGIAAFPTETVYGLGADAMNKTAVCKVFKAKGRPADNPLIIHISDFGMLEMFTATHLSELSHLTDRFCPGPLTMVLPARESVIREVTAGLPTVAIRFPSNETAQKLISLSCPLAAPSANVSGSPSPTSVQHVINDLFGRVDYIIDGGNCDEGVESTVVSLVTDVPRLLRPGSVTLEQLRDVLGDVDVDKAVTQNITPDERVSSPGMKYRHYAPQTPICVVLGDDGDVIKYINDMLNSQAKTAVLCFNGEENKFPRAQTISYTSKSLYNALREIDKLNLSLVYARCPAPSGLGLAVYNRLCKASGFNIKYVKE